MNKERAFGHIREEAVVAITDAITDDEGTTTVRLFKLNDEDIRKIVGLRPQQANTYGLPVIEDESDGIVLRTSFHNNHIERAEIGQFKELVADIEIPVLGLASVVTVEVRGSFEHSVELGMSDLLVDNEMVDHNGDWLGTEDELANAVRDRLDWMDLDDLGIASEYLSDLHDVEVSEAHFDEDGLTS